MKTKKYNIAFVESNALLRQGLKLYMEEHKFIQKVDAYAHFDAKEKSLFEGSPDLLIFDTTKDADFKVVRNLQYQFPGMKILLLSSEKRLVENISFAETSAINGFLAKNTSPDVFMEVITKLLNGIEKKVVFSDTIKANLLEEGNKMSTVLSNQEIRVLRLIAKGKTNRQASDILHLSKRTIETHRRRIIEKVGGSNIIPALVWCVTNGLIQLERDKDLYYYL